MSRMYQRACCHVPAACQRLWQSRQGCRRHGVHCLACLHDNLGLEVQITHRNDFHQAPGRTTVSLKPCRKYFSKTSTKTKAKAPTGDTNAKTGQTSLVSFPLELPFAGGSLDGESSQDCFPSISLVATHEVASIGGCNCASTCVMTSTSAKVQLLRRNTTQVSSTEISSETSRSLTSSL